MGETTDNRPNNQEGQSFTAREFELMQELVRSRMEKNEELQYSINIGVGVIAALGNPSHICLLRNMKEKSLAVIACDGKDTMSVRVPDRFLELHRSFKIHSKQFVYETLIGWGLNSEKTYSFKGEYLEEQKMVVFYLKND